MSFLTSKTLPRRTVLRGWARPSRCRFLEAMLPAVRRCAAGCRQTAAPVPDLLRAERHGDAVLEGEGRGEGIRDVADSRAARAVSRSDARALGNQRQLELHPRRRLRIVSHRYAARRPQRKSRSSRTCRWTRFWRSTSPEKHSSLRSNSRWTRRQMPARARAALSCVYTHTLSWREPDAAAADGVEPARRSSRRSSATAAAPIARRAKRGCSSTRAFWIR